jgi:DNA-binding transcriptional LysR family regulator
MDLRQMEIVQAIAETGSFTGAGKKLHLSQSAVSRQVLLLEAELNDTLFLRVGRRIKITPAGDAVVRLSQRVFSDVKETLTQLTDAQTELSGTIHLAGGMTICLYVFPELLKEYRRRHPRMDVKITTGSTSGLVERVRAGAADLALLTLPIVESDLVSVPVMSEEMLLVTHPTHPLARSKRIAPADLSQQRFVLFEPGSNSRRVIDEFFLTQQIEPKIVMETENVEILKGLARSGMGITIIPYQAVAREVRSGQLFCARMTGVRLERQTGWIYPRSNRVPRMIEQMMRAFDQIKPRLKLSPGRSGI